MYNRYNTLLVRITNNMGRFEGFEIGAEYIAKAECKSNKSNTFKHYRLEDETIGKSFFIDLHIKDNEIQVVKGMNTNDEKSGRVFK